MRPLPRCRPVVVLALLVGSCLAEGQPDRCRCSAGDEAKTVLHCSGDDVLAKLTECDKVFAEGTVHAAAISNATFEVFQLRDWSFASRLEHLSVRECRFEGLRLEGATSLTSLTLASNELRLVDPGWLRPLKSLRHLDLSGNRLSSLPDNLTVHLTHLNLSHNELSGLEALWFGPSPSLVHLNLSHNRLESLRGPGESSVLWDVYLPSLQVLDLSWNKLSSLCGSCFASQPRLSKLWLEHNQLTALPSQAFVNNSQLVAVYLAENPWHCDARLESWRNEWLLSLSSNPDKHRPSLEVQDSPRVLCASPPKWKGRSLFLFGFPLCERCACNALVSLSVEVNCTARGLAELPSELPLGTKVLVLAKNHIKSLAMPSKNVGYEKLLLLDVQGNEVSSADQVEGTRALRSLMSLNLGWNHLSSLPLHLLQLLGERSMDSLRLGHNPWLCDCTTVHFAEWLQHNKKVRDIEDIRCSDLSSSRLAGQAIYTLLKSDMCPQPTNWTNGLLDAVNGIMAFLILAILTKLLRDYWRQKRSGQLPKFFGYV